jgi:flavodoxin I
MSKVAVVYWSGTGNTEMMAAQVAEGAKAAGAETEMFTASEFSAEQMDTFDAIAYGWGDGEWMRTWEDTCQEDGAILACESVICNEAPDEEADASCQALGKALA